MRRELRTKTNFGLTQEEMAEILGISPSLWSMYESKRRELPMEAFALISEIRLHLETAKQPARAIFRYNPKETLRSLEQALSDNAYYLKVAERKQALFEEKDALAELRHQVLSVVEGRAGRTGKLVRILKDQKTQNYSGTDNPDIVRFALERKVALLKLEKDMLEAQILKMRKFE